MLDAIKLELMLSPSDQELEAQTGEPHIDGWPLYSGLPPAAGGLTICDMHDDESN